MNWDTEKCIDSYYGKYKNGILGKKSDIKLAIYPSKIEGMGFSLCDNKLSKDTISFKIPYSDILKKLIIKPHYLLNIIPVLLLKIENLRLLY